MQNSAIFHRPSFAHVSVKLSADQSVIANAGTMLWMDCTCFFLSVFFIFFFYCFFVVVLVYVNDKAVSFLT